MKMKPKWKRRKNNSKKPQMKNAILIVWCYITIFIPVRLLAVVVIAVLLLLVIVLCLLLCVFPLFVVSNCLLFTFFACVFLSCFTCHISCFLNNSLKMERTPVSIIVLLPHSTCNHRFKLFQLNLCFQLFVLVLYIE